MKRRPSHFKPLDSLISISLKKDGKWTTTPLPIKETHFGLAKPLGKRWKSKLTPLTTMVWPALLPPYLL